MPREGRFHQLLGDIALNEKRNQESLPHYQRAMDLNPDYFGSWLGAGVAQYRLGNRTEAAPVAHAQHGAAAHGAGGAVSRQHGARPRAMRRER